ncbi:PREDICTED: uncharacterized protein LOC104804854 [Tarenaya hassleriana]|nr:PREDICTED: uncharacterized protein LOC104804854 [Tarenaya hassleriana]
MNIHDHGVCVDKKKNRVRCNYCGKEVGGVTRLKRHLGGVPKDVAPCLQVPDAIRQPFRRLMLDAIPLPRLRRLPKPVDSSSSEERRAESLLDVKIHSESDEDNLFVKKDQKSIGRFFYENCIDFSAADSKSFRELFGYLGCHIPSSKDLKGWILQEEVNETHEYIKSIKGSWEITGCSILMDAWVDANGRDLVMFIADCPKGPVYLKSQDVSGIKNDIIALVLMIDEIIEEVGARNVVQVIGNSVSGWVGNLGKWIVENHKEILWSVSVSHCLELMLDKIGEMEVVKDVLKDVKNISNLILDDPSISKLFKVQCRGKDFTVSSKNDSAMPYLTLESVLSAKEDLKAIFASSIWKNTISASREDGIEVARLVGDPSFWKTAEIVLKCTYPLIRFFDSFLKEEKPHMGHIYEQIYNIKDTMVKEVCPYWSVVDEVREAHLHSPLHAAGYYLNPCALCSSNFRVNGEVATGLVSSLVHLVKGQTVRGIVMQQIETYRLGKDPFLKATHIDEMSETDPAEWWARKGNKHPELQRVAVKLLSQKCDGASRYKLKRSAAEKMLKEERSPIVRRYLKDFAFVHYNLQLQKYCKGGADAGVPMEIDAASGSQG